MTNGVLFADAATHIKPPYRTCRCGLRCRSASMRTQQDYALRSALPATLCFMQVGRSSECETETKQLLRHPRQGYGLFAANLWFKSHGLSSLRSLLWL